MRRSNMYAIHLICRRQEQGRRNLKPVEGREHVWISSCWTVPEHDAQRLIGGWIYLHPEGKNSQSEFGGVILSLSSCERREGAGIEQGIAFTFQARKEGRGKRGEAPITPWHGQEGLYRRPLFTKGLGRRNARPAGHPGTSISSPCRSDCPSACRCRKWPTISSAASVVPGMTNSNGRYTRGLMRESQG